VVHSLDTMLTVFVPLLVIILMNAGIGIKICHYTGRQSRVSGQGGGACARTESADEMYSNCSTLHKFAIELKPTGCGDIGARTTASGGAGRSRRGTGTETAGMARTVISTTVTGGTTAWRVLTRRHHTQVRVTSALLIVSTVFVVLNLPSYAFRLHTFVIAIRNEKYHINSMNAYIWQEIIQFLYYSNISSRFFLYMACSRNFRYAVKRLTCWRRRCGGTQS